MTTIHLRTSKNKYMADSDEYGIGNFQSFDNTGDVPNPFGELGLDLSPSELRETAYEVLIGACRSSGAGRPLTYISSSERTTERLQSMTSSSSPSLQRSLTSSAASKVKKALGLKSSSKKKNEEDSESESQGLRNSVRKRAGTVGELMRVQMRVSEQVDSRVRRGLLRVAAGQLGRRIESVVLPLELLQQFRSSDFPSQREYEKWQRRILKILETGLLLHPHMPLAKTEMAPQQLRKIIRGAADKPIETGKHSEPMQVLRNVVMPLACRSFDGSVSEICHWADGIPLNLRLYQVLLESCFEVNEETSVIEEVDEVLELIKKTWVILGINQILHNICFFWVLFCRYITTSQLEDDLLFASVNMLLEVEKDAKATKDPAYSKILSSTLSYILGWAEKRLLSYHATFYRGNIDVMQSVLSLGASAAKILAEDVSHEYRRKRKVDVAYGRFDTYIRSSVQNAFSQEKDKVIASRQSTKYQQNPLHVLSILAQNTCDLAFNEKEIYSPVLKRWHPLATGVAVVTLHTCYGNELKQFVTGISELTPEAIQVLLSAEKLEKDLVEMAVADSVDSEDGGKAIIQEMIPYETEAVIANLVKSWIHTRVDRLKQWVDRTLQQEVWDAQSNKGHFAPSAVEVLRIIDETLEAFFLLPIPMHPVLLPELVSGLDKCLHSYIIKTKSGCGSRSTFVPNFPALTRCSPGSKLFKKKDSSRMGLWKTSQVSTTAGDGCFSITQLFVRINTLYNIRKELDVLEKRTISNLSNAGFVHYNNVGNGKFEDSVAGCIEGIQQLSEATAYKVVFHDLSHVLCDYLYVGEITSSRIEPFLQELEQYLEKVSITVHDRVRTRVITEIMKASFEGFLLVLLAGGPSRAFTLQDGALIEEDFKFLMDLFWSNGDGLPADLIDKFCVTVRGILPLFHTHTENIIEQFKTVILNKDEASAKSRLPLPSMSGRWSPTDPYTILRVLCNRNDKMATKFLRKAYNLPKKL
ncbi:uncharacterized protein LOC111399403 [Olea europaea var. sylvestris]|uniref:uncharacterized protein LOC111399403 n=1 Tax=Olea europaea var. sylvestris TaxID=158386 RepID=UPI000C1D8B37|nr:uncharacterized protein LOC111399403 [Olea europaea var. sylvestris]